MLILFNCRGMFGPETGVSTAQAQQALSGMAQGFGGERTYKQFLVEILGVGCRYDEKMGV